jgi:acetyl-CoA carboxylase carboxyltransferase component
VKRDQAAREGRTLTPDEEAAIRDPILEKYAREASPYYATARLWDDGIIDPAETRTMLGCALRIARNAPLAEPRFGVFRM